MKTLTAPLVVSMLVSVGCATGASQDPFYSSQPAPVVDEEVASLFPGDAEILSDSQIRAVLEARAELPDAARLALVHLQHQSAARFWGYGPYWTVLRPGTRQTLATTLRNALQRSPSVSEAAPLPTFLLPEQPSVAHLREASARFQSDAVFVYRSDCQSYERRKFFGRSEAKAFCNVEAALLDTRTGIVPFTSQALQDFTVKKSDADANMVETLRRAETTALQAALERVGGDIGTKMAAPR